MNGLEFVRAWESAKAHTPLRPPTINKFQRDDLIAAFDTVITEARRAAIEECAKVADVEAAMLIKAAESVADRPARDRRDEEDYDRMEDNLRRQAELVTRVAAAIRALPNPHETAG